MEPFTVNWFWEDSHLSLAHPSVHEQMVKYVQEGNTFRCQTRAACLNKTFSLAFCFPIRFVTFHIVQRMTSQSNIFFLPHGLCVQILDDCFFWPPPLCRDCVVYVLLCLLTQSPSSSLSLSFGYCFSHPQTSSKSTHKTRVVGANKISMRERERRRQDQKLCRCSYSWGLYYSLLLYQRGSGASKSPSSSNPPSRSDY